MAARSWAAYLLKMHFLMNSPRLLGWKLQNNWPLQSATPLSNRSPKQYFCKVVAWVLECWCVGFIVIAAPPNWKPSLGSETHLPHPWWSTMTMKMIAESAKWCSRQMAGISAKFSHITLGTIFGTFQPATVGCCQKVQLCSNSNNTNRILWSAKSGWKFRLLWSQRASIAWQGKSRVVECSSPILADWSFPWLPDYIFLDCQIIFSHKLIFGAAPLFVELIAELALVLLLRESFPEASIGRPISLRQPPG